MKSPKWQPIFLILILVFLFVLPVFVSSPRYVNLINQLFLNIVLALGVYSLWTVGYINAAQPVFFGFGAYTVAILTMKAHWPFWLVFPMAGIVPAVIAFIFGWATLKMKGAYFMFVTIAFCQLIVWLFSAWKGLFGGIDGLFPIPQPEIHAFGLDINFGASLTPYYYLALILVVLTCLVYFRIHNSRLGRVWESVGKNPDILANTGVAVFSQKLICFVVSCFFAGLAGAVYAPYMTIASPGAISLWQGIWIVLGVLVGGIFGPVGAIIGTIFIAILNVVLQGFRQFQPLILGSILILVLLFMPTGIFGLSEKARNKFKDVFLNKKGAQPDHKEIT
jgi:branched-chain amino acid transport system permease protein